MRDSFNPLDHPTLLTQPRRLTPFSAWHEHIPAALLLVDLLRPGVFVELGTHYGDSYCAFCQAVQELHLGTHCYAVDTWEGDPQTGSYGAEVLADLRAHHDPLYGDFSSLIQSSFDEALAHFTDASIDLLHIDGCHTFEAVKHDFECWFNKLSSSGVVVFHDINERGGDFGVSRLWEDLARRYPHFEFAHGHGLGLLAVGKEQPPAFDELLAMSEEERIRTTNLMFQLGHRLELRVRIEVQEAERRQTNQNLRAQVAPKEESVLSLTAEISQKEESLHILTAEVAEQEGRVQTLSTQLAEKEGTAQTLSAQLAEKEELVRGLSAHIAQQEQTLQVLNRQLEEKGRTMQSLRLTLDEQTEHLDALAARIEFMSSRESELRTMLLDAHSQLVERDNEIQRLRRESNSPTRAAEGASTYIQYQVLIGRIREVVNETLPPEARVIVVSKGDDGLLNLNGREGWHFPQTSGGVYAGYYPADSAAAIAHLEELRAKGGEYLLFPRTAFWWLDHYVGFKRHLERHHQEMECDKGICRIFSVREDIAKHTAVTAGQVSTNKRRTKAKR